MYGMIGKNNWINLERDMLLGDIKVTNDFEYSSGTNTQWLTAEGLRKALKNIHVK